MDYIIQDWLVKDLLLILRTAKTDFSFDQISAILKQLNELKEKNPINIKPKGEVTKK
jgi:hypothetical protein